MRVTRCRDLTDFEQRARRFLIEREAEHTLLLGICTYLKAAADDAARAEMLVVEDDDGVAVAAARTPPNPLVLSLARDPECAEALAEFAAGETPDLSGVLATPEAARHFASRFASLTGRPARLRAAQRLHTTRHAVHPDGVPGYMRSASSHDVPLLAQWVGAFHEEALEDDVDPDAARRTVERWIESPSTMPAVWDDEGPVCMAMANFRTPNGAHVSSVYTPPERRERGYATACVAALTQSALESGRSFCTLYTDLANPTSNSIYRKIGYEPVCDSDHHVFDAG